MMGNLKQIFVSFALGGGEGEPYGWKMGKIGVGAASVTDMGDSVLVENSIRAAGAVKPVFCYV